MAVFTASQRVEHGIPQALACRALGVSRSWLYKHKDGRLPPRAQRREQLKAEAARLFALHERKYGSLPTCVRRAGGWVRTPWRR